MLTRVLTFTIHSYSALVSRKIYWTFNYVNPPINNFNTFGNELIGAMKIYQDSNTSHVDADASGWISVNSSYSVSEYTYTFGYFI